MIRRIQRAGDVVQPASRVRWTPIVRQQEPSSKV
jgi:hypothetical protein